MTTQKDPAAKEVNSVTTEVAATAQTDLDESTSSSAAAASLTFGERIEKLLFPAKIRKKSRKSVLRSQNSACDLNPWLIPPLLSHSLSLYPEATILKSKSSVIS